MEEEEDFPWAEWLLRPDTWSLPGVPKGTKTLTALPDVPESTSESPVPPDALDGTPVPTAPPAQGTRAPIVLSAPPGILEDCPDFPLVPLRPCLSFPASPAWAQPPDLTLPLSLVAVGKTVAVERWSHHHHCQHSAAEQRKEPPYDAKASWARGVLASSCSNFMMLI
ncbi:hypothetical protein MHYP_G00226640 [Metynnis hypsauchen]